MIRHIVLLRWNDAITDADLDAIDVALANLPTVIGSIKTYTHGRDLKLVEESFDYAIVADFDDVTGWRVYDEDDEHNRVRRELIAPFVTDRASARFEL